MFRLMIKKHNVTGLKYLCITKNSDWEKYPGSGVRWRKHLEKHGYNFSTELLFESEDYEEFVKICLYYSTYFNVALSEEFANAIPEMGYENYLGKEENNLVSWWKYASDSMKQKVYAKRSDSIRYYHANLPPEEKRRISDKISESLIKNWKSKTLEERRKCMALLHEGMQRFFEERGDNFEKWRENISKTAKRNWANKSEDEIAELGKKISHARLNMSEEAKILRAKRFSENYNIEKHRLTFAKMGERRKGINNPAAVIVQWRGQVRTLSSVVSSEGIPRKEILRILEDPGIEDCFIIRNTVQKDYEKITCPHCKKSTNGNKPSTFKRWHFDNCKHRELKNEDH